MAIDETAHTPYMVRLQGDPFCHKWYLEFEFFVRSRLSEKVIWPETWYQEEVYILVYIYASPPL